MARSLVLFVGFNLIVWRLNTVSGSYRSKSIVSRNTNVIQSQGFRNDGPAIPNIPTYIFFMYLILVDTSNPKCNVSLKICGLPFFEQNFGKSISSKQTGYRRDLNDHDKIIETGERLTNSDSRRNAYVTNDISKLNDNDKRSDNNRSNDDDDLKLKKRKIGYGGRRVFSDDSSGDENTNDDESTFEPNKQHRDLGADNDNDVDNYRRYYSDPDDPYFSFSHSDDIERSLAIFQMPKFHFTNGYNV